MNETMQTLIQRASCKSYKDTPVKEEDLKQIVQAGRSAPSGMNRQPCTFIAIQDRQLRDRLSRLNAGIMDAAIDPFYGAPAVIAVLTDPEAPTRVYDGSLAMGQMLLAARALGYGSCWIHRGKEVFESEGGKEVLKELGLPQNLEGIGFCIVGIPDKVATPKEKTSRQVFVL